MRSELLFLPVIIALSGCQLGLNVGYAKGYTQTDGEKDVMGEVRATQAIYKSRSNSARVVVYGSHKSALFDQSDNRKGLNEVGIGLQIGAP